MYRGKKFSSKIKFLPASYLLEGNLPSLSYGVVIFDIDGDDEPEIIVSNIKDANKIYKFCEQRKIFIDIAPDNFKFNNKYTISICIGDFLGNSKPAVYLMHADILSGLKNVFDDILIRTSNNQEKLCFSNIMAQNKSMSNPYAGRSIAAIDLLGDGKHGFYVVNYDAPSLFYRFNSTKNTIEEVAKSMGIQQFACGRSILAQSILNQNNIDILIGNENSSNAFFTYNCEGSYVDRAKEFNFTDEISNASGIAIADFDGNGLADIVLGNWLGMNSIFMQKERGIFENLPPAFFREAMPLRNIIVADFDNDGNEEIFLNNFDMANRMFRYLGDNEWDEIDIGKLAAPNYNCNGASIGDLTGNGFLDIFISTGGKNEQKNLLFLGVPNKNFWLRVQPLTIHNFPALSARVRMICHDARNQTKFICSGSGYLCQMEPVAHFGLGPVFPKIDRLEITWPSNGHTPPMKKIIFGKDIKPNTMLKIPYPSTNADII